LVAPGFSSRHRRDGCRCLDSRVQFAAQTGGASLNASNTSSASDAVTTFAISG
jgi:hypothetical protein